MNCGFCGAKAVKWLAGGVVGLTQAALGVGHAPPEAVAARREICRACEHATRSADQRFAAAKGLTSMSICRQCGCIIAAKTLLASRRCDLGKWEVVQEVVD
jgi:hypothetical protein